MVRLVFTFLLTVVVARWMYSEVQVSFPQAVPFIDYALEKVQIPTHDQWDYQKINAFVDEIAALAQEQKQMGEEEERAFLMGQYYGPGGGGLERF